MAIKTYKPITPSLRQRITLIKPKSEIKLSNYLFADEDKYDIKAGRNNTGRITIRRRGGRSSHKRKLRKIDRGRELGQYSICKVIDIQYDPNITGNIALLEPIKEIERSNINIKKKEWSNSSYLKNYLFTNKDFGINQDNNIRYIILAPEGLKKGDMIKGLYYNKLINESNLLQSSSTITTNLGTLNQLSNIPVGSWIYNLQIKQGGKKVIKKIEDIEQFNCKKDLNSKIRGISSLRMNPSNQGIYARAAGTYCILLKTIVDEKLGELKSIIRLPSNKLITVSSDSLASIGQVSNPDHNLIVKGKAGVNRWLGLRPRVRGEAMNIVDHPMGGATQGSGGKGKPKKTAWGKLAKWTKRKS